MEPEDLLERAHSLKPPLKYSELQAYERAFVKTTEPVAGVFSIWYVFQTYGSRFTLVLTC